jgi:histidine kinase
VIKQDGEEATILVTALPVYDSRQNITAAIEMSLDITEVRSLQTQLKTSEERYRALFNHHPNPIFVVSLDDLSLLDANDTALADYGFSREELLGFSLTHLVPENERDKIERAFMEGSRQIHRIEHKIRDGSTIWTNMKISYSEDSGRQIAIVTINDITEQLKTEQQLAQAAKLTTLGEMAAGVAHELNQPLSVIKSGSTFLSFLAKKVIEQAAPREAQGTPMVSIQADVLKSLGDEIDSHVHRASLIIQHLREFGRKSELIAEEVDVNGCIQRAFLMLGRQLEGRGIAVHIQLGGALPPIMADKNRIEQVFINLILNARDAIEEKASRQKEGHAEAALYVSSSFEVDRIVVEFRDTGTGIPEEIQPKIFDPFFTTKEVGRGTGLGLSISYGIVQDYGGTVDVQSVEGEGASFIITFPPVNEN